MRLTLAFVFLASSACSQAVSPSPSRVADEARAPSATPSTSLPADVTLPSTKSTAALPTDALLVVVSRTRVALGADGRAVAIPDPATWANGLDAKYKNGL